MFDDAFVKNTLTPMLAIIGAVLGAAGTGLGILNYRLQRRNQSVRARLNVSAFCTYSDNKLDELALNLKVVNESGFEITVQGAGVFLESRWYKRPEICFFLPTGSGGKDRWPVRVASRHAESIKVAMSKNWVFGSNVDTAQTIKRASGLFVEMADGKRLTCPNADLSKFKETVAEASLEQRHGWNR